MSKITNDWCTHMATVGVKGLTTALVLFTAVTETLDSSSQLDLVVKSNPSPQLQFNKYSRALVLHITCYRFITQTRSVVLTRYHMNTPLSHVK